MREVWRVGLLERGFFGQYPSAPRGPYLHDAFARGDLEDFTGERFEVEVVFGVLLFEVELNPPDDKRMISVVVGDVRFAA